MPRLIVHPQKQPLRGSVPIPSDRSITHRALILAALSNGPCEIRGFGYGADNLGTLRALRSLGVRYEDDERGIIKIRGVGLAGLRPSAEPIDAGRSATCLRLLTGVLSGQHFDSQIGGHPALEVSSVSSVVLPLTRRGARISSLRAGSSDEMLRPPLAIAALDPEQRLEPMDYALSGPNDHAKGALLLSGLYASGPTTILEPVISRDHTERLLHALGMPVKTAGAMISIHPPADPLAIPGFDVDLPGDVTSAAFLLVAAQVIPDSSVNTRRTGLNPTRSGALEVIRLCGGSMGISPSGASMGEPFGDVSSRGSRLRGIAIGGELAERALDEMPALAVLAARARGVTEISDAAELRSSEPDRLQSLAELLRAFGVDVEERPDGLSIQGRPEGPLKAARVVSGGDHRLAMAATLLGLLGDGDTIVEDAGAIAVSFPRYVGTLRALGAEIEVES